MTAYLPKQVKLFADGAIYSQAMQVSAATRTGTRRVDDGPGLLRPDVPRLLGPGYQLHVHVNGDAVSTWCSTSSSRTCAARRDTITHADRALRGLAPRAGRADQAPGAIVSGNPYYPVALADTTVSTASIRSAPTRWCAWATSKSGHLLLVPLGHADGAGQPLFLMWSGSIASPTRATCAGRNSA